MTARVNCVTDELLNPIRSESWGTTTNATVKMSTRIGTPRTNSMYVIAMLRITMFLAMRPNPARSPSTSANPKPTNVALIVVRRPGRIRSHAVLY